MEATTTKKKSIRSLLIRKNLKQRSEIIQMNNRTRDMRR